MTQETTAQDRSHSTIVRVLLGCGIASSLLYVATDLLASALYPGYSYINQAVSELNAVGAPTRPLTLALFVVYNVLVVAFAIGVWASAGKKRSLRVAAVMLVVYAVVGEVTNLFSPMNVRGTAMAANDVGHMVLTAVEVLSIVLFIAFGSGAAGRAFRIYSIATIVALISAGVVVGMQAGQMTAAAASTPWAGILERVNIYSTLLWILMLGFVLLRASREHAPATGSTSADSVGPTKKVTAFVGSPHRGGATLTAVRRFLDDLESFGDVEGEIVVLSDYDIGMCRGCKVCFERGEERCPLKDDRDVLIGKIMDSDAVVFASPNYSFQVSGVMKVFLDRLGFLFHRPRFHGKTATAIVVQGIYGGDKIRKYLEFAAGGLGFNVVKGAVIRTLEPMTDEALRQMDKSLAEQSRRFHDRLLRPAFPAPSLIALMAFRMSRTSIRRMLAEDQLDRVYYREHGWLESDYYYPTHLGLFKRAVGALFDWVGARMAGSASSSGPATIGPAPQ